MVTVIERISELEAAVSAVTTDFSRWTLARQIQFLDEGRAVAISNSVQNGYRIHPEWQQNLLDSSAIEYDDRLQESDCYTVFACPQPIKMKKITDGFVFVGNSDGTVAYSRVNTRGELLNMTKHPILNLTITHGNAALYEDGLWKIWSGTTQGRIQSLGVIGVFESPTALPFYNIQLDNYPIDNATMEFIIGYLKQGLLNQMAGTPITTESTAGAPQFNIPSKRR